jgi:elongation factor G
MNDGRDKAARCAALVGPYTSGKTSLLESILFATGKIVRKGSAKEGNLFGDSAPEAKSRGMTTEINIATTDYLDERWTFLDCPGSIEFAQDAFHACMVADIAVVVCEPEPERAVTVSPLLHFLDRHRIPHLLFVNKIDIAPARVRDLMAAYQGVSQRPLVLRQIPFRDGDDVAGYVDLISERAYRYKPGEPSDLVSIPDDVLERQQESRQELLETLADHDDTLMEQLLEDVIPPKENIFEYLKREVSDDVVVPVLIGSAERDHGVRRLLKALRHDAPTVDKTAERRGIALGAPPTVQIFKTLHQPHAGKLSIGRILAGTVRENSTLAGERVGNLFELHGGNTNKAATAGPGEIAAFGRVDNFHTGQILNGSGAARPDDWPAPAAATYSISLTADNRSDEVKLTGAIQRLIEEDPSYRLEQNPELQQLVLWGQGEQHLQIALDRLKGKYHVAVSSERPMTPYRETIRKGTTQHSRFKRQTGGHGQFGDVVIDVAPLPRGEGFAFKDKVVGGSVPRQFIPAVETGVREFLNRGPLGFHVVDLTVTLTDGKHHPVDSSEQAFKTAGRLAMSEALPSCEPVLLEPIAKVTVYVPNAFTAGVQRLISGRRGQILGYDAREGWPGWDRVEAMMPQSEMHDMIIELRSLTMGVGTYEWEFDHLQELTGRLADEVVRARQEANQ